MVAVWGADSKNYIGRGLTLYRDASVKWGGVEVGGIRISHMTHMDGQMTMALTATKGSRKPYTVKPLEMAKPLTMQLTTETAKDALNNAQSMDELEAIWKNKAMAPFRDALADMLAERKSALSPPDPDQPSTSSPDTDDAADTSGAPVGQMEATGNTERKAELWEALVSRAQSATDLEHVQAVQDEFDLAEDYVPLDRQGEVQDAINAAKERLTQEGN